MNTSKLAKLPTAVATATLAGAIALLAAAPAAAQPVPSYASGNTDETIHGTVASVNGPYSITVRDARGYLDNVRLHQGTIINPTGLSPAPGQSVTILGKNEGDAFAASEIDTPYALYSVHGYYGLSPAYHVGLRFGRGFGFGFQG